MRIPAGRSKAGCAMKAVVYINEFDVDLNR